MVRGCQHLAQPTSWKNTPFQVSATAYLIYSQLPPPPISEAVCSESSAVLGVRAFLTDASVKPAIVLFFYFILTPFAQG